MSKEAHEKAILAAEQAYWDCDRDPEGKLRWKMNSIPEDIYAAASKAYDDGFEKFGGNKIEAIAKAIWAERQRCAKIAEDFEIKYAEERDKHTQGTPDFYMNNSGSYAAMDISQAILADKEES